MDKFFSGQEAVCNVQKHKAVIKTKMQATLAEALALLQDTDYKVAAHFANCVRFGYYKSGKFIFADGAELEEKYLVQLRIFNNLEEIYLQKQAAGYYMQYINDAAGATNVQTVDSASQFFGHKVEQALTEGFVELWEAGRKIKLVLPVADAAEKYKLVTRSYIMYDEQTGQAGYAYYRWLDIRAVDGRDE